MSALSPFKDGFLDELEKLSAARPVKETRRGYLVPSSRKGRRSMRVDTLLKKEKEGTLGGYKLAGSLVPFSVQEDAGAAPREKRPGDVPSRDDVGPLTPKREDGRGNAATLVGPTMNLIDYTSNGQMP